MEFEAAESIIYQVRAISKLYAELSQTIARLEGEERETYKLALGKTMGEMYLGIIYPICAQYPELDFTKESE